MNWYTLSVQTNREDFVAKRLNQLLKEQKVNDLEEVFVPLERIITTKNGKAHEIFKKILPGYVLIKAEILKENKLNIGLWSVIKSVSGVKGLVGVKDPRNLDSRSLVPIPESNIEVLKSKLGEEPKGRYTFEVGASVKVTEGPFMGSTGQIQGYYPERELVSVAVNIFGRDMKIEVAPWSIEVVKGKQ